PPDAAVRATTEPSFLPERRGRRALVRRKVSHDPGKFPACASEPGLPEETGEAAAACDARRGGRGRRESICASRCGTACDRARIRLRELARPQGARRFGFIRRRNGCGRPRREG